MHKSKHVFLFCTNGNVFSVEEEETLSLKVLSTGNTRHNLQELKYDVHSLYQLTNCCLCIHLFIFKL